jgi:hypothetical protein
VTDPSSEWRVWLGGGLLSAATPLSDERRALIAQAEEKERLQAERDAELRSTAVAEKLGELRMQGVVPTSVGERLEAVAVAQDRQDRRDQKADEQYTERFGHGRPRPWVGQLAAAKAEREARQAAEAETPASVAEIGKLKASLARLKQGVFAATGYKIPL